MQFEICVLGKLLRNTNVTRDISVFPIGGFMVVFCRCFYCNKSSHWLFYSLWHDHKPLNWLIKLRAANNLLINFHLLFCSCIRSL